MITVLLYNSYLQITLLIFVWKLTCYQAEKHSTVTLPRITWIICLIHLTSPSLNNTHSTVFPHRLINEIAEALQHCPPLYLQCIYSISAAVFMGFIFLPLPADTVSFLTLAELKWFTTEKRYSLNCVYRLDHTVLFQFLFLITLSSLDNAEQYEAFVYLITLFFISQCKGTNAHFCTHTLIVPVSAIILTINLV